MRTALGIAYDGTDYAGWQKQSGALGVQELVEKALAQMCGHPVNTVCCGRTDAGVHAECQVVHFDHESRRDENTWLRGANSYLPPAIRILPPLSLNTAFSGRINLFAKSKNYWIKKSHKTKQICSA